MTEGGMAVFRCGPTVSLGGGMAGGGLYPTRLAAVSRDTAFAAMGDRIFRIQWDADPTGESGTEPTDKERLSGIRLLDYRMPVTVVGVDSPSSGTALQSLCVHPRESQVLASVDARGLVQVHRTGGLEPEHPPAKKARRSTDALDSSAALEGGGIPCVAQSFGEPSPASELGWGAVDFCRDPGVDQLAMVHQLSRRLRVYDVTTGAALLSRYTQVYPRALRWLDSSTLCIAEFNQLSVADTRLSATSSCALRIQPSHQGRLNTVAKLGDHLLAAAGDERMVFIYDTRTWKPLKRWKCPCKLEITSLHESSKPGMLYMSGMDNEFLACQIEGTDAPAMKTKAKNSTASTPAGGHGRLHQAFSLGVRGDSRWTGVAVHREDTSSTAGRGDSVYGLCASGTFCVLSRPVLSRPAV
mmetsp:Transcript_17326/g.50556  ORF Transcript_17326/g.50556 Transcript_17326/m.50556 type:complete len:412 (-) Transcript_17326:231-1466(-)